MKQLILGGARSGKSRLAEQRATASNKQLIYIATAQAGDHEMSERIKQHQLSRADENWLTIESPLLLAKTLVDIDADDKAIVVDCLTLWLSNILSLTEHKTDSGTGDSSQDLVKLEQEKYALVNIIPKLKCDLFLVSNEVGSGIVPLGQLSREFVDQSGWLHQSLAKVCDQVTLVVAGLPMELKK